MSAAKQPSSPAHRDPFVRVIDWYRGLPRAGKWGASAGSLMAAFLVLDQLVWPTADALNDRADRLTGALERAAERAEGLPDEITASALVHGPNAAPTKEVQGMKRLAAAIDSILRKKGVKNYGQDLRRAQPLAGTVLPDVAAALGGKMGRTVADLRFEAGPDDVTAIIAEFDANPDIDCITDLKLSYNPVTKRVGVQMMVEKWGVVPATPARGGS